MGNIKVLVVDDQRLVREGISSLLNLQEGISVVAAGENGREGVRLARELKPDVILMDIRMPVQDGIASVEILQKSNFSGKIIMLTTFDDEEYILKSMRAGALGYLMKDIPVEDLARAVRQAHHGLFQMAASVMNTLMKSVDKNPAWAGDVDSTVLESIAGLTSRERDVFLQIGRGLSNSEIAELLYLSEGTVKNYVSGILTALGLRDRVQAALLSRSWADHI